MSKRLEAQHQAEVLRKAGFTVVLDPVYLDRLDTATDDLDFADLTDHILVEIEKDGARLQALSLGDRRVELVDVTPGCEHVVVARWCNQRLPEAVLLLLRQFGDGQGFEFAGRVYEVCVHNNGRFEDFVRLPGEPWSSIGVYFSVPLPNELAVTLNKLAARTLTRSAADGGKNA
jgi:hypothetical protein